MHNSIWRAIGWSVLLTAFGPLGASQGGLAGTQAEPDALGTPLPSAAIYDPDPNHLWNRLFAVFYRQKIANNSYDRNMTGWGMNRVGEPHWIGPDVLDPPLGYHPKFLLEDEPFARGNAVLDEFISQDGATRIHDPLKCALLQRDLWAVFDVLAETDQIPEFPFPTSTEFINRSPLPPALEQHRATLELKLARVIRSLALSRNQIEELPDTYSDAIRSGAFSNVLETNRYDFLPHDLFAADSGWHEILPSHLFSEEPSQILDILEHTLVAGGRSIFRAFVKLPENSSDTNILASYAAENVRVTRENDRYFAEWKQFWSTNEIGRSNVLALEHLAKFDEVRFTNGSAMVVRAAQPEVWRQFTLTNRAAADNLNPKTSFSVETERNKAEWERFWSNNKISRSNFLALISDSEAWRVFSLTNSEAATYAYRHLDPERPHSSTRLPSGMRFLLLREMISLDENGQMVPTHVVESVQFRTRSHTDRSGVERSLGREVELSRAFLFQGKQGGLRPISGGESRASFYNSLGHLRVDEDGNGPSQQSFPGNCGQCHMSNDLLSHVATFSRPHRSVSIEPIIHWKQKSGKLDLLRQLMLEPVSDGK
jgi:hypothetical protein